MNRKHYMLGFTLVFVIGLLVCGCSGQSGAAPQSGNLPVSNQDANKPGEAPGQDANKPDAAPGQEANKPPAENGYPLPGNENPPDNTSYPAPGQGNPASSSDNPVNPPQGEMELPVSIRLAVGTLALEDTDNAVTPEQAANLLLLWKVAYNLSTADDAKPEDLEVAFEQIQDAMTAGQIEAIESLELTRDNLVDLAEKLGIDLPEDSFPTLSADQQATMQASGQGGMPPAGATPGAGGPGSGGQDGGFPGGMGTPPAGGGQNPPGDGNPMGRPGGPNGIEDVLYQAIIEFLESKIQ
jgi:hypothetical protein